MDGLELAEMADEARILHEVLDCLVAHGAHAAGIEAMESLLEGRPFRIDHLVLQAGAEDAQRHQREIAVVAHLAELRRRFHLRQARREPVGTEPLFCGLADLGEGDHHPRSFPPVAFSTCATSFCEKASSASSVSVASSGWSTTVMASDFLPSPTPAPA